MPLPLAVNSPRVQRVFAVSAMLALVAAVGLAVASPAQAVADRHYQNTSHWGCILGPGFGTDPDAVAETGTCGGLHSQVMDWKTISKGSSPSDHKLVQLKSTFNGKCLDSNDTNTGAVWERTCTNSLNQRWEVFPGTTGSGADTYTFKSWGAWKNQGLHRCMRVTATTAQVKLAECNTGSADQKWAWT